MNENGILLLYLSGRGGDDHGSKLEAALKQDHVVRRVEDETALYRVLASEAVTLMLLDVRTAGLDPQALCRRFGTRMPVLCLTDGAAPDTADALIAAGATDVLPWATPIELTRRRLAAHLAQRHAEAEVERRVRGLIVPRMQGRLEMIQRLGEGVETEPDSSGRHICRMSAYAQILGSAAGLNETEAGTLARAATIYDIGKVGIPERILTKPGRLTANEWTLVKTHTEIGARLIDVLGGLGPRHREDDVDDGLHGDDLDVLRMARTVALSHHEKWDGTGYPRGLAGEAIPLVGRIVSICDVFDAVTTERPYKRAWEVADAIDLLDQGAGTHFDPQLVPAFLKQASALLDVIARHGEGHRFRFGAATGR